MIVVNLFGSPNSGKSTAMARLFSLMKASGYNVEMASEVVKDSVYANDNYILHDQILAFALQRKKLKQLEGKVDYVITDSPLLLSHLYGDEQMPEFYTLVDTEFARFRNVNFFLDTKFPYSNTGRIQNEAEAAAIKYDLAHMLSGWNYFMVRDLSSQSYLSMLHIILGYDKPESVPVCS